MSPNDADGMAYSVDPDQTRLIFYLSENLGSLEYVLEKKSRKPWKQIYLFG